MAGFFDGEGSFIISIKRPHTTFFTARLGNTDFKSVKLFKKVFGGSLCSLPQKEGYKPMLVWSSCYTDAELCAKTLLPYLKVKAKQAKLALDYCKYRRKTHKNGYGQGYKLPESIIQSDLQYRKQMSELNHGRRMKI